MDGRWPDARSWLAALTVASVLAGCSHRRVGTVGLEDLPPPEIAPSRLASPSARPSAEVPAQTLLQALPRYPDAALGDEVHCTARLLYHIEVDGTASLVRLEWDPAPAAEYREAFEKAIREAVATWSYTAARRYRWKKNPDGSLEFEERAIPTARRAIIRFRVEKGRGVVE